MRSGERVRRVAARILGFAIIVGAIAAVALVLMERSQSIRSDVAEIDAPVVHISPTVPGRIIAFHVDNTDTVKKGDVLFEIDPEPYELRLRQAEAELRVAESEVAQGQRNIAAQQTNADVAAAQIRRARLNLELAKQTLERLEPLLPQGYVTAQEVDSARTAYKDARVTLQQALQQSQGASQIIGTLETRKAQRDAARATVALARRDLRHTKVRAPFDGKIVGLSLAVGEYVITGETVFTLINTEQWEAVAYFRETDLGRIDVGDAARVFVLADSSRPIHGRVTGIGWGVRSEQSANILGMPLVTRSLDWVTVAQRFPVYVRLENPPEELMRIGATAAVVISSGSGDADADSF